MISRKQLIDYADSLPLSVCDNPFDGDFDAIVFRHSDTRKWFGLVMKAPCRRLGLDKDGTTDILNVKCDPLFNYILFQNYHGIVPAYHMNRKLWISVILDSDVPVDEALRLIDDSYRLTSAKPKKGRVK